MTLSLRQFCVFLESSFLPDDALELRHSRGDCRVDVSEIDRRQGRLLVQQPLVEGEAEWEVNHPVVENRLRDEATDELELCFDLVPVTRFRVSGERHRVEAGGGVNVLDAGIAARIVAGFVLFHDNVAAADLDGVSLPQGQVGALEIFGNECVELEGGAETSADLIFVLDLEQGARLGELVHDLEMEDRILVI